MVIDGGILKNNDITLFLYFTFIPKTGMELPKPGLDFYSVQNEE